MFPEGQGYMNIPKDIYEAYKKDYQNGMVSIGNVCAANCFFCSQRWNPPGVIKDLKRFLTIEEIKHFTDTYLDKASVIASAFHTNIGEFFLHPDAAEILDFLAGKNKLKKNTMIVTNGMDLTQNHIKIIKKLNLGLFLSLNSANIAIRKEIMGSSYQKNKNAIDSVHLLDKYGVSYSVWIVPLRRTLDNADVENTVRFLKKSKARSINIHGPGYTKYTPSNIARELAISDKELFDFVLSMKQKYNVNIDLERMTSISKVSVLFNMLSKLFMDEKSLNSKKKLFLCAATVEEELSLLLKQLKIKNYKIKTVKSRVFGGNIDCAGLLLVEDYLYAIKEFLEKEKNKKPEVIILPHRSFDINMEDLSMAPVKKIEDKYKIKLILV